MSLKRSPIYKHILTWKFSKMTGKKPQNGGRKKKSFNLNFPPDRFRLVVTVPSRGRFLLWVLRAAVSWGLCPRWAFPSPWGFPPCGCWNCGGHGCSRTSWTRSRLYSVSNWMMMMIIIRRRRKYVLFTQGKKKNHYYTDNTHQWGLFKK